MSTARLALPIALCLLVGCIDQPLYVTDLPTDADDDGGREKADDSGRDGASQPRKDAGAGRCMDCPTLEAWACSPGYFVCFQCGCCDDEHDCEGEWNRDRSYECQRLPERRAGLCVESDKRPNAGPP